MAGNESEGIRIKSMFFDYTIPYEVVDDVVEDAVEDLRGRVLDPKVVDEYGVSIDIDKRSGLIRVTPNFRTALEDIHHYEIYCSPLAQCTTKAYALREKEISGWEIAAAIITLGFVACTAEGAKLVVDDTWTASSPDLPEIWLNLDTSSDASTQGDGVGASTDTPSVETAPETAEPDVIEPTPDVAEPTLDAAKPEDVAFDAVDTAEPQEVVETTDAADAEGDTSIFDQLINIITFSNPANEPADMDAVCGFDAKPIEWAIKMVKVGEETYMLNIPPSAFLGEPAEDAEVSMLIENDSNHLYSCDMDYFNYPSDPTARWMLYCSAVGTDEPLSSYDLFTLSAIGYAVEGAEAAYLALDGTWYENDGDEATTCTSNFDTIYTSGE